MSLGLPLVSFLCTLFLAGVAPAYWTSRSVPMISLSAWLFICNIFQGVNAVVWAGNSTIRNLIWCDIATKILLGSKVALPAACLCLCNHLRRVLSTVDMRSGPGVLSFDCILCFVSPVVYMALHVIVQDHRFDLAEDFGCAASVYRSVPAIILVWLPPLILCIATLALACFATHLCLYGSGAFSGTGERTSSRVMTFNVFRLLLIPSLIVSFVLASTSFSIHVAVSSPGLLLWSSWDAVHEQLSSVNVISPNPRTNLVDIDIAWWIVPTSSLVLIAVSIVGFTCGAREDVLDGYRALSYRLRAMVFRQRHVDHCRETFMDFGPHMMLRSSDTLAPVPFKQPSLNDIIHPKSVTHVGETPITISIPEWRPSSPSVSPTSDDSDAAFTQSTLTFLESPVGLATLDLVSPPPSSQRRYRSEMRRAKPPMSPPPTADFVAARGSAASPTHSILSEPWPRPPSVIPLSPVTPVTVRPPTPGPSHPRSRIDSTSSFSTSFASSTVATSAYVTDMEQALHDSPTLPNFAPFADAGVPVQQARERGLSLAVPTHTPRTRSKDRIMTRNLSLSSRTRQRARQEEEGGGAIYMSVVQETV